MKFYKCNHCNQIIFKIKDVNVPVSCCGEKMEEIIAGSVDASKEKHIPVYTVENGVVTVKIGEVPHPMLPEHYIEWVALKTNKGVQIKYLNPSEEPLCIFALTGGENIEEVYAYCNIHGLWKS